MVFEQSVTLRQLRFLKAVIEAGGFSAAARLLLTTQPTVSYEIARLERLAGAPLVERRGGRVRPTTEGSVLYDYAMRTIATIDEAGDALLELRGVQRGRLAIGADGTFGAYVLPRLLGAFRHRYPSVELYGTVLNSPRLVESVRDGSLELVIICDVLGFLGNAPDLVRLAFDECRFVIAAPRGHHLVGRTEIDPRELAGEPFVVREAGSWPRRVFDQLAEQLDPPPAIALEFAVTEPIKQSVTSGLGLTVISDYGIRDDVARGDIHILDVQGFPVRGPYCLLRLKERRPSFAARAFVQFMQERKADRPGRRPGRASHAERAAG